MTRKTWDRLEFVVFIIFILACIALMLGVLFEHGCISVSDQKPTILAKAKVPVKEKCEAKQTNMNLTLHWAALKGERNR